jgi:hypothetical protein
LLRGIIRGFCHELRQHSAAIVRSDCRGFFVAFSVRPFQDVPEKHPKPFEE